MNDKKFVLIKKTMTVLLTATLIVSLSGCFEKNIYNNNNYKNGQYYNNDYINNYNEQNDKLDNDSNNPTYGQNDSQYQKEEYIDQNQIPSYESSSSKIELDDKAEKIINSVINFDGATMLNFASETSKIVVEYPYQEYYEVAKALAVYNSITPYSHYSDMQLIKNNRIESDTLYNVVLQNNEKANFATNRIMDASNLKKVCTIICDTINDYLKNNDADINLLNAKLSNLKIQKYTEMSYGYFDNQKGIMGFDISKINKSDDFYKKIVQHETYHFLQASSMIENDETSYDNRMGVCYKLPNLKVNSLYWDWYYEGAAEYLTMNKNNTMSTELYANLIGSFNLIKISCALNSRQTINSFENLSLQNDLNEFFNYFNVISKEEAATLMYAYNIINSPNSFSTSTDFYNRYKEVNGTSMSVEEKMKFEKLLKNSVTQTETKLFYSYLAESISNKNIKVEDIFALISLFENNINVQNRYYVAEHYYEQYSDFFDLYMEAQNEFFQIIANKLNVELSDVYDAYNAYNEYKKINIENNGILNQEQKQFYSYIASKKTSVVDTVNYKFNYIINNQYMK